MRRTSTVTVRSTETGLVFPIARQLAERHDTLEVLDADEAATAVAASGYESWAYNDLRAEVARRNALLPEDEHIQPASAKQVDLIAALVADDTE